MSASAQFLYPAAAARSLGVSVKALRLYERYGLIEPLRTLAGWRTYGPSEMARAAEIVALRALGFSIAQIVRVLRGGPDGLADVLAAHQNALERRVRELAETIEKIRLIRTDLIHGSAPSVAELAQTLRPLAQPSIAFELPWPWGGERFELRDIKPINYIIGPLGSGKTRLAIAIAGNIPGAIYVELERSKPLYAELQARLDRAPGLKARVDQAVARLVKEGAEATPALITLIASLETDGPSALVVDMIEHGLNHETQAALATYLRRREASAPALFLLTRSSAILDLAAIGPSEAIILCPANHSPPIRVAPYPGAPSYEAVATCLASPEVRARTEGMIAMFPKVA